MRQNCEKMTLTLDYRVRTDLENSLNLGWVLENSLNLVLLVFVLKKSLNSGENSLSLHSVSLNHKRVLNCRKNILLLIKFSKFARCVTKKICVRSSLHGEATKISVEISKLLTTTTTVTLELFGFLHYTLCKEARHARRNISFHNHSCVFASVITMSKAKGQCLYNANWECDPAYRDWVKPVKTDKRKVVCSYCDKIVDISTIVTIVSILMNKLFKDDLKHSSWTNRCSRSRIQI